MMKRRYIGILVVVLILLDQLLKIWIKTNMTIGEAIMVFEPWFQLRFVENNGAAFGMQIASSGGVDWGKIILSGFRVCMVVAIVFYINRLIVQRAPKGVVIALALVVAGALGNIIDSAFYGLIFAESTTNAIGGFGGSYAPFMMGRVVDMFYFPLFQWNSVPKGLSFLVDYNNYFFGAIFNLADTYISIAVVYIIHFQRKFFA